MIKELLYSTLKNNSAVAAIVSTRVYSGVLPQNCTLPAISFFRISASRGLLQSGDSHVVDAIFQIDVWAKDAKVAENLSLAVKAALHGVRVVSGADEIMLARLVNEVDLTPDTDMNEYHIALDFSVQHREG